MKKSLLLILAVIFALGLNAQTTIYDVQYTTEAGDGTYPSLLVDQSVTVTGIVTAITGYSYYIQDGDGGWNGIYVYDDVNTPAIGDEVTVSATVSEYYGLTELGTVTSFTNNSTGNTLPNAVTLATAAVNDEQYEGVLVYVADAECTAAPDAHGQWYVNGDLQIDDSMYDAGSFTPTVGTHYNITGVVDYSFDEFGLHPRDLDDIQEASSVNTIYGAYRIFPNPAINDLNISSVSNINNITVSNVIGQTVLSINDINTDHFTVNVAGLTKGVYLINIENADGTSAITKFVKK